MEGGYVYLEASGVVQRKKCRLFYVILTPDGTNSSYLDIYDGESTSEPKVMRLRVQANRSFAIYFNGGLLLQRGLYLSFETNLQAATVVVQPEK